MRSRLWTLILQELPFPFRQIGTEIARILTWGDHTASRAAAGAREAPGWYVVIVAGCVTVMLSALLFSPYVSQNDRNLQTLAIDGTSFAKSSRTSLEASNDWSVQDRWRLAHMFVEHRPPRSPAVARIDSRLVHEDDLLAASAPDDLGSRQSRQGGKSVAQFDFDATYGDRLATKSHSQNRDPEVRLDLNLPPLAAQDGRLINGQLVRDSAVSGQRFQSRLPYRPRDERLLVQAEWSHLAECVNEDVRPIRPLTRRSIPIPEPVYEEPAPIIRDDRRPDIAWEVELIREFLPVTGEFPPNSRSFSEVAHSEMPPFDQLAHRSRELTRRPDDWYVTTSNYERPIPVEAYISRVESHAAALDEVAIAQLEEEESRLGSFAEVALRLELHAPQEGTVGKSQESSVLVRNEGRSALSLIRVRESLNELETVTDAKPAARIDRDMLEREVLRLPGGRERRLGVTWVPSEEGSRVHRAQISVQTAVATTTNVVAPAEDVPPPRVEPRPINDPATEPSSFLEPEPLPRPQPRVEPPVSRNPSLACDLKHLKQVQVADVVELEIEVRNTGDVPLSHVMIHVDVAEQFKHHAGRDVEYPIGNLAVNEARTATLRLLASVAGRAINQVHVVANEPAEASSQAEITIAAKPESKPVPAATPKPVAKATPKPVVKPAPKAVAKPASPQVKSPCCCPQQPAAYSADPWAFFEE